MEDQSRTHLPSPRGVEWDSPRAPGADLGQPAGHSPPAEALAGALDLASRHLTGPQLQAAIAHHTLARATVTGLYAQH